jgi:RNA polymerase sigma-70 factor (ECF subfamily)
LKPPLAIWKMRSQGKGSPLSADELFRSHARFVARFLTRLGVHADDLDDVIQEVFLVVHTRGGYVPGPAKPTSYLGTIALHAALHQRRRRSEAQRRAGVAAPDQLHAEQLDPAQKLELNESVRSMEAALATLSPVARATLLLVEQEGESCTSIAASMNVPVGTVYWRLHQARRAFRQAIEAQQQPGGTLPAPLPKQVLL